MGTARYVELNFCVHWWTLVIEDFYSSTYTWSFLSDFCTNWQGLRSESPNTRNHCHCSNSYKCKSFCISLETLIEIHFFDKWIKYTNFYYYFLNVLFFLNFSPSWHFFDLGQKIKIARSLIGPTGLLAWRLIYLEVRFKFFVTQIPWS